MNPIRLAAAALAVPLLLAATPALANDGRRDAEDACRDRIAAQGRHDPKLDRTRYDTRGPGATLVGEVRSGKDDRHSFQCTLDRNGRVRGVSLTRIGSGDDRNRDRSGDRDRDRDHGRDQDRGRDHDRGRDRDRDRGRSGLHGELVGRDTGDAQSQLRTMGYERTRGDHWFLGATGECIVVRNAGSRIADVRKADSRDCR